MAYIGNTVTTQGFTPAVDFFNGNGSTTAFTLSRPVASVAQVQAVVENVPQKPGDAYTVSGNTITFTSAPPSGTSNIYVYYTSPITQVIAPSQGTVGTSALATGLDISAGNISYTGTLTGGTGVVNLGSGQLYKDASGNVGVGTSTPSSRVDAYYAATPIQAVFNPWAGSFRTGTGTFSITGANPRGIGVLMHTNQNTNTTLPYGGNYEVFGALSAVNSASGGNYAVYGMAGFSRSDGASVAFRADCVNTNASSGVNYGYYVGSVTGAQNNYGVYVADTAASNYFGGNLLVGTTTVYDSNYRIFLAPAAGTGVIVTRAATTSHVPALFQNSSGSQVGAISCSNTATTYSTSSDYRLKEDVQPMVGALARVASLKPVTYKWKLDGTAGEGFIAHELQEVVPDCVTGDKDAVDAEGKPVYQGIDTSFLVATLTAAIQELNAKVEALQAQLEAK